VVVTSKWQIEVFRVLFETVTKINKNLKNAKKNNICNQSRFSDFSMKTSKPYLKSVMFEVRHDNNYVIIVTNAGLDGNDIALTTVHCTTTKQLK